MLLPISSEACGNSYVPFLLLSTCTLASDVKYKSTWASVTKPKWVNVLPLFLQLCTLERTATIPL